MHRLHRAADVHRAHAREPSRGEARRKVVRRFPYALVYLAEPEHVEVIAVFHTSRDPEGWQDRVRWLVEKVLALEATFTLE